ncbi:MAG: hypothetical protein KF774_16620 [Planctomyces sp.]|nr:hypothetical protein [Planctomyces sp.]
MNAGPTAAAIEAPPAEQPRTPIARRRFGWRGLLVVLLLLAPLLGWAAAAGWNWRKAQDFRNRAQAARKSEDWRTERSVAREWAQWDPAAGEAWWFAAEAAQKLEDLEDLANSLGRVPATDPNAVLALVEKANLEWTVLNRPSAALETSLRQIQLDPRVVEIHSRVISFYAMNMQRAPMVKAIRRALEAGAEPRESYAYLMLADMLTFVNGGDLNSRWLAAEPDEVRFKVGLAVNTAMGISRNADIASKPEYEALNAEADRQLAWFLDQAPHDVVLLTYLMHRAYEAGDVDRVGELLQQIQADGVDDHMVWVFRAWYHTAFDEFDEAEAAIQEALRLHPISPLAHHEYANLLRKARRPEAEVVEQQQLAATGRDLRAEILQLPNVTSLDGSMLERIRAYAGQCGDAQLARALARRLEPTSNPQLELSIE